MNRVALVIAAAHWVDRVGQRPSRRTIQAFLKLNLGKAFRADEIDAALATTPWAKPNREPVGSQRGHNAEPPREPVIEHKSVPLGASIGASSEPARTPLTRAPHKVLELELDTEIENSTASQSRSPEDAREEKIIEPPVLPAELPSLLPDDVNDLKRVAQRFMAVFANSRSAEAQKRHGPAYTNALAICRSRRYTTAETWGAFADAFIAANGRPLFAPDTATRYLPARAVSSLPQRAAAVPGYRIPGTPYTPQLHELR